MVTLCWPLGVSVLTKGKKSGYTEDHGIDVF